MAIIGIVGGIMMISTIIGGTTIAAIQGAQKICRLKQQAAKCREETVDFVTQSRKVFEQQRMFQEEVNKELLKVKKGVSDSLNQIVELKQSHAIGLAKLQIISGCVVIIVFMLLLGKKLKIY